MRYGAYANPLVRLIPMLSRGTSSAACGALCDTLSYVRLHSTILSSSGQNDSEALHPCFDQWPPVTQFENCARVHMHVSGDVIIGCPWSSPVHTA